VTTQLEVGWFSKGLKLLVDVVKGIKFVNGIKKMEIKNR